MFKTMIVRSPSAFNSLASLGEIKWQILVAPLPYTQRLTWATQFSRSFLLCVGLPATRSATCFFQGCCSPDCRTVSSSKPWLDVRRTRPSIEGCPQWSPRGKEGWVPECLSRTYHVQSTSHVLSSLEAQSPNPKKRDYQMVRHKLYSHCWCSLVPTLCQTLSWAVRANAEKNDTEILISKEFRVYSSLSFPIPAPTPWLLHMHHFLPSQPPAFHWLTHL